MAAKIKFAILFILGILVAAFSGCGISDNWAETSPTILPSPLPTQTPAPLPDLNLNAIFVNTEAGDPCPDPFADLGVWVRIMN